MTYSIDSTESLELANGQVSAPETSAPAQLKTWLFLALVAASLLLYRQLLWHLGLHVSQRSLSAAASVALLIALGGAAWTAATSLPPIPPRHGFSGRLLILVVWVIWLAGWGLIRGNFANGVFKETIGFLILVLLLMLGRYDAVWQAARKPLTIFFYVSLIAVLLTYRIPGVATGFEGTFELKTQFVSRNMNTIGFGLGEIMQVGLLLGVWGLAEQRRDLWRWLMIGSLLGYLFIEVLLFEFRGALVSLTAVVLLFALLSSRARGRLKLGTILLTLLASGIVLGIASQTEEFALLMHRFQQRGLFESRITESQAFFRDMSPFDLLVGRGLDGWYEGPRWAGLLYQGHRMWATNHFGFLAFVLRGGFPFLVFVTSFAVPMFLPKLHGWRQVEYNFAAMILTPILIFNILLNPVAFEPDGLFLLVTWGFCFARFSTTPPVREQSSSEYSLAYGHELVEHY